MGNDDQGRWLGGTMSSGSFGALCWPAAIRSEALPEVLQGLPPRFPVPGAAEG